MSAHCCPAPEPSDDPSYRRALWVALIVNAVMFVVEVGAAWSSGSVALMADAIDFFGDSANYALSLVVVGMAVQVRARAALVKAAFMAGFGVYVLVHAAWQWRYGGTPQAITMGTVGFIALLANAGVAWMLFRFRNGDANMQSVWLCSRNDAIGNIAVMVAALGVFGTGSAWPDLAVAGVMGMLALSAALTVMRQARRELLTVVTGPAAHEHGH
jgi:cation diffusion facilitator family transporter